MHRFLNFLNSLIKGPFNSRDTLTEKLTGADH